MKTKTTAVSLGAVLLVAAGVAGYASCGSSSNNTATDGGHGGTDGGAGAGGAGGAHDGGGGTGGTGGGGGVGGAGGTGNCGGNFAPTDGGAPDATALSTAVQVIVDGHCTSCHTTPDGGSTTLPQSLDLTDVTAIVGRISTQCGPADGGADAGPDASVAVTGKQLVDPDHPEISYLVDKVIGHAQNCGCFSGVHQPPMCDQPDSGQSCLTNAEIQIIVNWIATGAQ
jgi:hypothetical protein